MGFNRILQAVIGTSSRDLHQERDALDILRTALPPSPRSLPGSLLLIHSQPGSALSTGRSHRLCHRRHRGRASHRAERGRALILLGWPGASPSRIWLCPFCRAPVGWLAGRPSLVQPAVAQLEQASAKSRTCRGTLASPDRLQLMWLLGGLFAERWCSPSRPRYHCTAWVATSLVSTLGRCSWGHRGGSRVLSPACAPSLPVATIVSSSAGILVLGSWIWEPSLPSSANWAREQRSHR